MELRALDKRYAASGHGAPKHALIEVDLAIPRGALFGLLGPNGAGKSTLINILAGLVNKTSGSVAIWGFDIDRAPRGARAALVDGIGQARGNQEAADVGAAQAQGAVSVGQLGDPPGRELGHQH